MKARLNTALISVALALLVLAVPFASGSNGCVCPPCPPPECFCPGKVTGGGQIEFECPCTCIWHRATFGFNIRWDEGDLVPKGELEYVDHWFDFDDKPPMLVHAHDMLTLCVYGDNTKAFFTGECTINHQTGYRFAVYVEDNGEPGRSDVFMIWLFQGDSLIYQTVYIPIRNGNIQIHKKP